MAHGFGRGGSVSQDFDYATSAQGIDEAHSQPTCQMIESDPRRAEVGILRADADEPSRHRPRSA